MCSPSAPKPIQTVPTYVHNPYLDGGSYGNTVDANRVGTSALTIGLGSKPPPAPAPVTVPRIGGPSTPPAPIPGPAAGGSFNGSPGAPGGGGSYLLGRAGL